MELDSTCLYQNFPSLDLLIIDVPWDEVGLIVEN